MEFEARDDGAEHPDPAARCTGAGTVRETGGSGVPGVVGVERRPRRPADDRADDRQQTGRRTGSRRRAPGRARRVGARRGVPDDRTSRVLRADPAARRRVGHLHRPRPAYPGGRRRCRRSTCRSPGDERTRPQRDRRPDRRHRADGHAGMRCPAHAGADVARRGRRRAGRRGPAGRVGPAEFHAAALDRIGRRRGRIADRSGSGSPASPPTCSATARRRPRRARSCRSSSTAWCAGRWNWHSQKPTGPVDGFAWLTLGSVARREAMPSSDVDSALSWRDDMSSASEQLRAVAVRTHQILDGCGLPSDRNGAVAYRAALLAFAVGVVRRGGGLARRPAARSGADDVVTAHRRPRGVGRRGAAHGSRRLPPDARRAFGGVAAAAARRAGRASGQDPVAARRVVAARRHIRPQAPRDNADRQPRALGRPERRRRLRVDARAAERGRAGGCDQRR